MEENFITEAELENIKVEREVQPFKLYNLKLIHHYWDSIEDIAPGMLISTSVELKCTKNDDEYKYEWHKIITHTYLDKETLEEKTIESEEKVPNIEKIISDLEQIDLRKLANNYFTDQEPECYKYWELNYNYKFKIVGTYDQEIDELSKISTILNFSEIIKKITQETLKNNDKAEMR